MTLKWLRNLPLPLIFSAFGLSFLYVWLSQQLIPLLNPQGFGDFSQLTLTALLLLGTVLLVVLFYFYWSQVAMHWRDGKTRGRGLFGRLTLSVLALAGFFLILSFIYGLISVALYTLLASRFSLGEIKGFISMLTNVISLMLLPLAASVFCGAVFEEGTLVQGWYRGWGKLNKVYPAFLALLIFVSGLGWLMLLPLRLLENNLLISLLEGIVLTGSGGLVLLSIPAFYQSPPQFFKGVIRR